MNLYNYDENTKEYLYTSVAEADPEETKIQGKFIPLIPANCTEIQIPTYNSDNQIPVFENDNWVIKPDYRKNYYKVNNNLNVEDIITIGEQEAYYIVDKATGEDIKQNSNWYKISSNNIVKKSGSEYEQEQAQARAKEFYTHFIKTSLGNYRLQPKGYANAQQAMDVTNTMAMALGGLTEQLVPLVIFYETPDFTKAEECTEEWLVAHQKNPSVMTLEEWQKFYFEFCQLYAMQQYKTTTVNGDNNESTTNTEQSTDVSNEVDTKENNTKLDEN